MRIAISKTLFAFLCSTALLSGCGGGDNPSSGTDTVPNAYSFTDKTGVDTSSVITSDPVTISGIDAPSAVSVSGAGGTYSVGCTATYVSTAGTINNNQTVCARHLSSAVAGTSTSTTLTVGGVSDAFTSTTAMAGADTTPNAFNFTDQTGVAASTVITSAPVTITGINSAATVTVTGGTFAVGCTGTYGTTGTITNNQTVCARHTSSATASTATNTTLTIGGVSDTFTSTTAAAGVDTTPDAFSFTDQTGVATSTVITSAPVTITGINSAATITVTGGTFAVGCTGTYGTTGTITNNQTVCARHTSSATASTATNTTLTIGGVSDTFTSTTAAAGVDTTPDAFSFTDQTGVATSTVITSAPVTITGINSAATITVTGGTFAVGCTGTYGTTGTITNNQTVCARHTSSATASTATNTTLTIGGVSDTFTSTTAATVALGPFTSVLPFLAGNGDLRYLEPGSSPVAVDSGLTPPPTGATCYDCFPRGEVFFSATASASNVTNLHASRLAYIKNGAVLKVDITQEAASNQEVAISSLTDACRIVRAETSDYSDIDNTAVVIERAGTDGLCGDTTAYPPDEALADNAITVIRLNSPTTGTGSGGVDIPLVLDRDFPVHNPLHAQTNASGAVTGYVSFETRSADPFLVLVRRDANLANPVTLLALTQTTGASIERADLTRLFVTATPDDLKLFRMDGTSLSPTLYTFTGFNAGNPIQDGVRDATHLYFSDRNLLLRIPVDSTSPNATVIATLVHPDALLEPQPPEPRSLIIGNRALDRLTGYVVFEAQDSNISINGGVFSAATNGSTAAGVALVHNPEPDTQGGYAILAAVASGRAYITVANHNTPSNSTEAVKIGTAGPLGSGTTITSAYWAGLNLATSFEFATDFTAPPQSIFLARRAVADGIGTDTVTAVNPATGVEDPAVLGAIADTSVFVAVNIHGLGRYSLARVEKDRSGSLDHDVYLLDAGTSGSAGSLTAVTGAQTAGANDIPLDSLQRLNGNLCLLCL